MSIQLSKADLVVKGDFCAGGEIFNQFERSSSVCLGLDFFVKGRLRGVSALWVQRIHYQKRPFSVKMFGEVIGNTTQKRKL
jgi:hypothetical protein